MNLFYKIKQKLKNKFGYSNLNIPNPCYTGASDLLEIKYGHLESKRTGESMDGFKNPVPWFTYPAIDYLNQLDLSDKIMLEYGSGNSSKYFSKKVKQLYSIEHDKEWFEKIENLKLNNHTIIQSYSKYAEEPIQFNVLFDIILIDGIDRDSCAKVAIKLTKKGSLIILDNSDRHPDVAEYFRNKDFIEVDFHGLGPINDYTWTTSIFFDRQVILKPLSLQPVVPLGGGF